MWLETSLMMLENVVEIGTFLVVVIRTLLVKTRMGVELSCGDGKGLEHF